jgi:predicted Zn-ribbon and HTH transcriptional regulator
VREDVFAVLAAEPDNPYDTNAVAMWIQGLEVGYLSREDAQRYDQAEVEVLICGSCGRLFERIRVRGRKPTHCPECRSPTA